MPPNEKRGRIHSSTVTVSVRQPQAVSFVLREEDLDERFTKKTGPGGQNRNKREMAVVLTHRPTGLSVTIDSRSQADNRRVAREQLLRKLRADSNADEVAMAAADKRAQVGTGQRGDKVRSYQVQNQVVCDHRSGRKAPLAAILAGRLELLR